MASNSAAMMLVLLLMAAQAAALRQPFVTDGFMQKPWSENPRHADAQTVRVKRTSSGLRLAQEDDQGPWAAWGYFADGQYTKSNMGHLVVTAYDDNNPAAQTMGGAQGQHSQGQHSQSSTTSDADKMYSLGWVEGYMTAGRIAQHYSNMWAFYNITTPEPLEFLEKQHAWLRAQSLDASTQGVPFWDAIRLILSQFDGMLAGYNAKAEEAQSAAATSSDSSSATKNPRFAHANAKQQQQRFLAPAAAIPPMNASQLYFLCSMADMMDITAALKHQAAGSSMAKAVQMNSGSSGSSSSSGSSGVYGSSAADPAAAGQGVGDGGESEDDDAWSHMSAHELEVELNTQGRCSALIKVAPDFSDLWVGQVAWFTYSAMLRVFKHYNVNLTTPGLSGGSLAMSSYYGQLSSDDDFYLLGPNQLVVLQTTNRIINSTLFDRIHPEGSALAWQRVRAASLVANSGQQWADVLATHNSGTYTNTWAVLDMKLWRPRAALAPGLLHVVEQVPGRMRDQDMTATLEAGYFAMYNVPVLPGTYEELGYPEFVKQQSARGPEYAAAVSGATRQLAPRAQLFRRDHGTVVDTGSMRALMRSNNWQADPYSRNVSTNAICGRGDVDPLHPRAAGCYDGKVASISMAMNMEADVINGPPHGKHSGPPFSWRASELSAAVPHTGQPPRFDFEWQKLSNIDVEQL